MRILQALLIATLSITITSCSLWRGEPEPEVPQVPIIIRLPLPPRPTLPSIDSRLIECLSDETVRLIIERDRLRKAYADQLELIIRSTHKRQEAMNG